jgi:SAM-dependent methyltransferase
MSVSHPAKFSDPILDVLRPIVAALPGPILDPFAGTGRIHELGRDDTFGIELEPEWADQHERTAVGNALALPYVAESFGSIVTSPTYGNRFADQYDGRDGSRRHTYRIALDRPLSPDNSGALQWGVAYRDFHRKAWREAWRVLIPGGRFVLNVSDHIRKDEVVPVTVWHLTTLEALGFQAIAGGWHEVRTRRQRDGANYDARVPFESIIEFEKPEVE